MSRLGIQVWDIDRLVPYELNAKKHEPAQVKRIAKSIADLGWNQPITVDKDGVIIAGHGRRLAVMHIIDQNLQIKGWADRAKVPVLVRDDLTPDEVRAMRLADNRVAEGAIDTELFRKELETLEFDLGGIFDAKELEFSVADLGTINTDAFIDDIAGAVDQQTEKTKETAAAVAAKPVAVGKLFGFTEVSGKHQLALRRLVHYVESSTGLKGEEAFAAFASQVAGG